MKFLEVELLQARRASLPVRGAWIEMRMAKNGYISVAVAPRAGSVD